MRVACSVQCVSYKRQGYAPQAGATIERPVANARHAVRYLNARQAVAIIERRGANTRHAARYRYARQAGAMIERSGANARSTGNNDRFQGCRDIRGIITI